MMSQKSEATGTSINRFVGFKANPMIGIKLNRQVQSDDDSMVSDSMRGQMHNNIIEEQSESVFESMYESNQQGYDSNKQSPIKRRSQVHQPKTKLH